MNILLTGSTGFIGRNLLKELLRNDKYKISSLYRKNTIRSIISKRVNWIKTDLESITLKDLKDIQVVIHLAATGVSPKISSQKELECINISQSIRLIRLAAQAGVKRFIATGTCLEYGNEARKWNLIPPNSKLSPMCPYSRSKAKSFNLMRAYSRNNEIEFYYGRIFSAYGEGQFRNNFWPSLKQAALSGKDFLMTSGEQVRDFITVEEVSYHLKVAVHRTDIIAKEPFIVNIGSGVGKSLKDFAMSEWRKFGATGKLVIGGIENRPNEIPRMVADIEGLKY
tara:strand:- start:416 stop:1261 length:846 start_codon:yes stop_codon:yes gene_type:complete